MLEHAEREATQQKFVVWGLDVGPERPIQASISHIFAASVPLLVDR